MTSRMLKELKNLSPWQWDGKPETVGNAIVDQFEKVLAPQRGISFPLRGRCLSAQNSSPFSLPPRLVGRGLSLKSEHRSHQAIRLSEGEFQDI